MTARAESLTGYRLAREAQLERFEAAVQGVDRSDTNSPEYREYFGLGEYAGGGVEAPLTFKAWLVGNRRPEDCDAPEPAPCEPVVLVAPEGASARAELVTSEGAFYLSGKALAELAGAGCVNARAEIVRRQRRKAARRAAALVAESGRWVEAVSA